MSQTKLNRRDFLRLGMAAAGAATLGACATAAPPAAAPADAPTAARLAQRNRVAVLDAENATHESRALIEFLTVMERSLGQYGVLRDRDFYVTYQDARRGFQAAAQRLGALNLNAILRRQLGGRRLRLTDDDRRRLTARAYRLGRAALRDIATIATPDTLLRWHRQFIARTT